MDCSCHIANATKELCKVLEGKFNVNNFLIDLYFHFDWSSQRKSILEEFLLTKNIPTSLNLIQFGGLVFQSVLGVN